MTEQSTISLRDAFAQILMRLAEEEPRVVVLDADLSQSTRTSAYRQKYPSRYLNVGIAEQNMVSVAAGIALVGGVPLVNTFAAFLTRRAADQIAISVAFPKLNVKFFGFHAGVNLGEDGATQQSVEDLAIMRAIPGIRVYSPCDARDLEWAVADAMAHHGPTYVRLARFPSPVRLGAEDSAGGFRFLRRATGPVVVTTGTLASEVLGAVEALATEGREVSVVGVRQVKPLSPDLVTALGPGPLSLAVAEEHNVHGGLADAVSALLDNHHVCHCLERIGIEDRFGESGPPAALLEHLGLAGEALASRLRAWHDYSVLQAAAAQPAPGVAGTA